MKAVVFSKQLTIEDRPEPALQPAEAKLRLRLAGICNTDLEIVRGYMGYSGILGHEFVGELMTQAGSLPAGQRVVGEINCACGSCAYCRKGLGRHCPNRTTVGIFGRDGAMADFVSIPVANLHAVPEHLPDEVAVFTEPLAAACEILEQVQVEPQSRVAVVGDGKLGLLVVQVLRLTGCELTLIGKHTRKMELIPLPGVRIIEYGGLDTRLHKSYDLVVEATGDRTGLEVCLNLIKPRGTLVLKSTFFGDVLLNTSRIVVDEIRIVGSRCGPFPAALRLLDQDLVSVRPLISDRFPLREGVQAFARAMESGVLKVLLQPHA